MIVLPLFSYNKRYGRYIPDKSGLNWGYSNNGSKTGIFDASISIPKNIFLQNQNVIEPYNPLYKNKNHKRGKSDRLSQPIYVVWNDGKPMDMSFEGRSSKQSSYPKQLTSFNSRKELGIYLRTRLIKEFGENIQLGTKIHKTLGTHANYLSHWYYIILTLVQPGAYFAKLVQI